MKNFLFILCLLALAACTQTQAVATSIPATATRVPPTATLMQSPTFTPIPPTNTPTSEPTSEGAPGLLTEQLYRSEVYGYSVAYPVGWQPVEMEDMLILVADPVALSTQTPTQAVILTAGQVDTFLGGLLAGVPLEGCSTVLQAVTPQLLGPSFQLGAFSPIAVGDLPAIGAPLTGQDESGVDIQGYAVLTLSEDRAAILLATAPVDEWPSLEPLLDAILETFAFIQA